MAKFTGLGTSELTFRANFSKFREDMNQMNDMFKQQSKKFMDVQYRAFHAAGTFLTTRVTLPILGYLSGAVWQASSFEAKMNAVRAVTFATNEEFRDLTKLASELGASTRYTASEAAEAMANLARSGMEVHEVLDALPSVLTMAAGAEMDLADAAQTTTSILRAFNLEAKQAGRVVDVLAQISINSNTTVADLGNAMKYAAPVAAGLGVTLEETAAALGVLANSGLQAEMQGTALRAIMTRLASPTGTAKDTLARFNIETKKGVGQLRGLVEIFSDMRSAGMTYEDLAKIFEVESLGAANILMRGANTVLLLRDLAMTAEGVAQRIREIMNTGLAAEFRKLMSAVEQLSIKFGMDGGLLDTMTWLVGWARKFIELLNDMPPWLTFITAWVMRAVAIVGPAVLLMLKIMKIWMMTKFAGKLWDFTQNPKIPELARSVAELVRMFMGLQGFGRVRNIKLFLSWIRALFRNKEVVSDLGQKASMLTAAGSQLSKVWLVVRNTFLKVIKTLWLFKGPIAAAVVAAYALYKVVPKLVEIWDILSNIQKTNHDLITSVHKMRDAVKEFYDAMNEETEKTTHKYYGEEWPKQQAQTLYKNFNARIAEIAKLAGVEAYTFSEWQTKVDEIDAALSSLADIQARQGKFAFGGDIDRTKTKTKYKQYYRGRYVVPEVITDHQIEEMRKSLEEKKKHLLEVVAGVFDDPVKRPVNWLRDIVDGALERVDLNDVWKMIDDMEKMENKAMDDFIKSIQANQARLDKVRKDKEDALGITSTADLYAEYQRLLGIYNELAASGSYTSIMLAEGWKPVQTALEEYQKAVGTFRATEDTSLDAALSAFNVKTVEQVNAEVAKLNDQYNQLAESGKLSERYMELANMRRLQQIKELIGGKLSKAEEKMLKRLEKKYNGYRTQFTSIFTSWADGVKSITKDLSEEMILMMFEGQGSFGRTWEEKLQHVVNSFKRIFARQVSGIINDLIHKGFKRLLKSMDGVIGKTEKVGKASVDAVSGATSAVSGAAAASGEAATKAVTKTASATGKTVTKAIGSSMAGIVGAIGSVGSMISGIIGNFQKRRMNDRLLMIVEGVDTLTYMLHEELGFIRQILFQSNAKLGQIEMALTSGSVAIGGAALSEGIVKDMGFSASTGESLAALQEESGDMLTRMYIAIRTTALYTVRYLPYLEAILDALLQLEFRLSRQRLGAFGRGRQGFDWSRVAGALIIAGAMHWEKIWNVATTVWDRIWKVAAAVWGAIWSVEKANGEEKKGIAKKVWDWIRRKAGKIWDAIRGDAASAQDAEAAQAFKFWGWMGSNSTSWWNWMGTNSTDFWNFQGNSSADHWNFQNEAAKETSKTEVSMAAKVWTAISNFAGSVWGAIGGFGGDVWNAISGIASAVWKGVFNQSRQIWDGIGGTATQILNIFGSNGTSMWNSMGEMSATTWNDVRGFGLASFATVGASMVEFVNSLQKKSGGFWKKLLKVAGVAAVGFVTAGIGAPAAAGLLGGFSTAAAVQGGAVAGGMGLLAKTGEGGGWKMPDWLKDGLEGIGDLLDEQGNKQDVEIEGGGSGEVVNAVYNLGKVFKATALEYNPIEWALNKDQLAALGTLAVNTFASVDTEADMSAKLSVLKGLMANVPKQGKDLEDMAGKTGGVLDTLLNTLATTIHYDEKTWTPIKESAFQIQQWLAGSNIANNIGQLVTTTTSTVSHLNLVNAAIVAGTAAVTAAITAGNVAVQAKIDELTTKAEEAQSGVASLAADAHSHPPPKAPEGLMVGTDFVDRAGLFSLHRGEAVLSTAENMRLSRIDQMVSSLRRDSGRDEGGARAVNINLYAEIDDSRRLHIKKLAADSEFLDAVVSSVKTGVRTNRGGVRKQISQIRERRL